MRKNGAQVLTYTLRLPDAMQADALRLLETARQTTNTIIETLWPRLDEFADGARYAWKHVTALLPALHAHGSRQWRCEAETAGRILRAQAARKAAFDSLQPILSEGLIVPADGTRTARKNRKELLRRVADLREQLGDDADKLTLLTNVIEQACNFHLAHDRFPADYVELQPVPTLQVGLLTFAADDGMEKGQVYRLTFDAGQVTFRFRAPTESDPWRWVAPATIPLPEAAQDLIERGVPTAPQLRVLKKADGEQVAVLDLTFEVPVPQLPPYAECDRVLAFDWGVRTLLTMTVIHASGEQLSRPLFLDTGAFDGRQARVRRQIDQLKAKRDALPDKHPDRARLQREIDLCWAAFSRRNKAMAHLATNVLLAIAGLYGCKVIAGEWLASLKSVGRGRDTQGRWRNWRNNTTLRSAITTVLRYKAKLAGIRLRFEYPRGTSHTCPHCGQPADTFKSPEHTTPGDWGAWLKCLHCGWNGSRDYAAALNIGRLAVAFLVQTHDSKSKRGFRVCDAHLKPVSYTGAGTALPFPPSGSTSTRPRLLGTTATQLCGWPKAIRFTPLAQAGPGRCEDSCR
jgi:putative transposase